jgi:hypothetical protein
MIKLKNILLEANKIATGTAFTLSSTDPYEYKNLDGTWYTKLKSKDSWLNMKSSLSTANYNNAIKLLIKKSSGVTIDKAIEKKKDDQKPTTKSDKSAASISIIIGDSQAPWVFKNLNPKTVQLIDELQEGGKGVGWLRDQVAAYPVSPKVKNVVLCIGTNGGYSSKGSAEAGLFTALRKTFPNAKIYAVQGSWGWGGVSKYTEKQVRSYYINQYQNRGAILIEPPIGDGKKNGERSDPHGPRIAYEQIGLSLIKLL